MHVNVLYTFRSVSRAIPMVSGSGDPNKDALHMNTFKVSEISGLQGWGGGCEALPLRRDVVVHCTYSTKMSNLRAPSALFSSQEEN